MKLFLSIITIIWQTLLFNNSSAFNADDLGTVIFTNIVSKLTKNKSGIKKKIFIFLFITKIKCYKLKVIHNCY